MRGRIGILTVIMLFMIACDTYKPFTSYYSVRNMVGPDAYKLMLKNDSTFVFEGWSDVLGGDTIIGRWIMRFDTLILHANKSMQLPVVRVEGKNDTSQNGICIRVIDEIDKEPIVGADVYINGSRKSYVVGSSDVIYPNENAVYKIRVKYLSVDDSITIGSSHYNNIVVFTNIRNKRLQMLHLTKKWIKKGRSIIPLDSENKRLINDRYFRR